MSAGLTETIKTWKSRGMSIEKIKFPITSDESFYPKLK